MVGFVPGTRTIDLTYRPDLMPMPEGNVLMSWKKRPKLNQGVEAWLMENVGPGGYWTADPEQHGWAWGLQHSFDVDWKNGSKAYRIYASLLSFADADRAMLFKLTWI